jgi:exportin-T
MATPEEQIVAAISIAGNPAGHPAETHVQAVEFLTKVRRECDHSWRPALNLFVATTEPGRHTWDDTVRLFALTILDDFLDIRYPVVLITLVAC